MTPTLVVQEYGIPIPIFLSGPQRDLLLKTGEEWKKTLGLSETPLVIEQTETTYTLRARQVAGVINVGGMNIEIAPKFLDPAAQGSGQWRQAFWRILTIAGQNRTMFDRAQGIDSKGLSIADLLADVFLNAYSRGSRRGMPLQYAEHRELSVRPQGSFDAARFGEWMAAPWHVPSVTDALTSNTPLSRLLSWAANQLKTLVRSSSSARALGEVAQQLSGSGNIPGLIEAERLSLGMQHDALKPALGVAVLLLRGHGLNHGEGGKDVIGFLWKTADVYEQFLFWLCQAAARHKGLTVSKKAVAFGISDTESPLMTTPDIVFKGSGGQYHSVLDAKYKSLNSVPKSGDSYQILTAANVLGCPRVGLVYPASVAKAGKTWTVKSQLGAEEISLSAFFIDPCMAATREGTDALIDVIGEWLAGVSAEFSP